MLVDLRAKVLQGHCALTHLNQALDLLHITKPKIISSIRDRGRLAPGHRRDAVVQIVIDPILRSDLSDLQIAARYREVVFSGNLGLQDLCRD